MDCPYCHQRALLVFGSQIYPHRQDLSAKPFWRCQPCEAWVGCHPGTQHPLGRLANATLRSLKSQVHIVFDPIWEQGGVSRSNAYKWLSTALGIPRTQTHVGMFDEATCLRAIEACRKLKDRT